MMLGARTAAWRGKALPYDAEVEWVGILSSNKFGNLDFRPEDDDVITWTSEGVASSNYAIVGLSSYLNENVETTRIIKNGYSYTNVLVYFRRIAAGGGTSISVDVRERHTFRLEHLKCTIDGKSFAIGNMSAKVDKPQVYRVLCLGNKVYGHRIERRGIVIVDLKPVRLGNQGYYYDSISGLMMFGDVIDSYGPDKA